MRILFKVLFLTFLSASYLLTRADLLVTSQSAPTLNTILRYSDDGTFLGIFAAGHGLADPLGMTYGPDGNLYVASGQDNFVLRFDGRRGGFLGVFASGDGLQGPINLTFGPDGNLYVSNGYDQILRFNGTTGAFIDAFASGGLLAYPRGLKFGPDGNLYVVNYNEGQVLRYNGITGAFMDVFAAGTSTPNDLAFGPDGNLYVSGGAFPSPGVFRYNGVTGAFIDQFAAFPDNTYPIDFAFGPDGNLYVVSQGIVSGVLRFNGHTGSFIDYFVPDGRGGVSNPFGIIFIPGPQTNQPPAVSCSSTGIVQCGSPATVTAVVSDPNGDALSVVWTVNGAALQTNNVPPHSPGPTTTNLLFTADLPLGTNFVAVSAKDGSSNIVSCSTPVIVLDTTPPLVHSASAEPSKLWPPNHKMVPVAVQAQATDTCGTATWRIVGVTSNESGDSQENAHTSPDWLITGAHTVSLRAERSGKGQGRIYSIMIQATDGSGNLSAITRVMVSVPHD